MFIFNLLSHHIVKVSQAKSRFQEEKPSSAGGRDEIGDCLDDLLFSPSGDSWGIGTLGLLPGTCCDNTRKGLLDRAGTFFPLLVYMCLFQLDHLVHLGKTNKQETMQKCKMSPFLKLEAWNSVQFSSFITLWKLLPLHMDFVVLMSFNHHSCSTTANAEGKQAS